MRPTAYQFLCCVGCSLRPTAGWPITVGRVFPWATQGIVLGNRGGNDHVRTKDCRRRADRARRGPDRAFLHKPLDGEIKTWSRAKALNDAQRLGASWRLLQCMSASGHFLPFRSSLAQRQLSSGKQTLFRLSLRCSGSNVGSHRKRSFDQPEFIELDGQLTARNGH